MSEQELIELLAEKEHASWARWMHSLFSRCQTLPDGSVLIPADLVGRWRRQTYTPYDRLGETEKESDRAEVMHILPIIKIFIQQKNIFPFKWQIK